MWTLSAYWWTGDCKLCALELVSHDTSDTLNYDLTQFYISTSTTGSVTPSLPVPPLLLLLPRKLLYESARWIQLTIKIELFCFERRSLLLADCGHFWSLINLQTSHTQTPCNILSLNFCFNSTIWYYYLQYLFRMT